jgi:hypothetical protein
MTLSAKALKSTHAVENPAVAVAAAAFAGADGSESTHAVDFLPGATPRCREGAIR